MTVHPLILVFSVSFGMVCSWLFGVWLVFDVAWKQGDELARITKDRANRLHRQNAELRAVLRAVEWSGTTYGPRGQAFPGCPYCRGVDEECLEPGEVLPAGLVRGHEPDCGLAAAIGPGL